MSQKHLPILNLFDELKFNLGFKTLVDFIKGDINPTIERNNLDELNSYGVLFMLDRYEIMNILNALIKEGYLEKKTVNGKFEVIDRTSKGTKEIFEKKFVIGNNSNDEKPLVKKFKSFAKTEITNEDKKLFNNFNFFLEKYNEEQKKAIISNAKSILCIAGAGSGKTTVLTKRIEFLKKFKDISQKEILAITFTRKAKQEMQERLKELGLNSINVQTFNSFSEKNLRKYGKDNIKIASFSDKIKIVRKVMNSKSIKFEMIIDNYFSKKQIREKSADELFFIFVGDIFTIVDYFKNCSYSSEIKDINLTNCNQSCIIDFSENENNSTKKRIAKAIYEIASLVEIELKNRNLRDFSDQIINCLDLFKENPEFIPYYKYILVDEFQDVNKVQVDLLKILNSDNIFAVGDPRQAIYGWRGSEIEYIMNFPNEFENCEVIQLKKNYRSSKKIVNFFNLIIKDMGLEDLESAFEDDIDKRIFLIEQSSELLERKFLLEAIKNSKNPRNEIFVLARTNRILENFADFFAQQGIKFAIKSEEEYKNGEAKEDEIVLATVHSIKGMEAKEVYLVSCNNLSFPNKVQDNFIFSLMKQGNEYNKEAEELRLFYVACSRAKEKLIITYTGNYSKFITSQMLKYVENISKNKSLFDYGSSYKKMDNGNTAVLVSMLKDWRSSKANESGLPLYMILNNNAIEEIAHRRPSNKLELGQVNGMGTVKVMKYGDEILKILGN